MNSLWRRLRRSLFGDSEKPPQSLSPKIPAPSLAVPQTTTESAQFGPEPPSAAEELDRVSDSSPKLPFLWGDIDDEVHAVGTSYYQAQLEELAGGRLEDDAEIPVVALLMAQPDNPYDAHAVAVSIEGVVVGHLSRELAPIFEPWMAALGYPPAAACDAFIVGGWDQMRHGVRSVGKFGVTLTLAIPLQLAIEP